MITYIDVKLDDEHCYNCETLIIARKNENKATALRFHLTDEMLDKWIYVEILKADQTKVISSKLDIDIENKTAVFVFTNQITDVAGEIKLDIVIKDENNLDWKTFRKNYIIEDSICASDEIQEECVDFINEAQKIVNEANNLDIDLNDCIITITKKDGTQLSQNIEGKQGPKGDPGVIKMLFFASKSDLPEVGSGDTLYFVKVNEPTQTNYYQEFAWVNKGTEEEPFWDWEDLGGALLNVDLSDYVKNTDIASSQNLGLVRVNPTAYGVGTYPNGNLYIVPANETEINEKTHARKPIAPCNLDYAVGSVFPVVTQAEYDELVANGTVNENLYYCIKEE